MLNWINNRLDLGVVETPYRLFSLFVIVSFTSYYFLWAVFFPEGGLSNHIYLRMSICLLAVPLVFPNYWPKLVEKLLPVYWCLLLTVSFPFFFTYTLIMNEFQLVDLINGSTVLAIMIMLVDIIIVLWSLALGILIACLLCWCINPNFLMPMDIPYGLLFIINSISLIIIGGTFSHRRYSTHKAHLRGIHDLSKIVSHELRTPLLTIKDYALGLKKYLPAIFDGYLRARNHYKDLPEIRPDKFRAMLSVIQNIEAETNYSNKIIDMLLINTQDVSVKRDDFIHYEIIECLERALERYPYRKNSEREKINWSFNHGFQVFGSKILLENVIFNLIKNALYSIDKAGKGEINIWLSLNERYNELHIKDTGCGISKKVLPKLFKRFYTTKEDGSGIGLFISRIIMQSFGGEITCDSSYGEYAHFTLIFPKVIV